MPGWSPPSPRRWPRFRSSPPCSGMYWDISLHIDNGRDPGPLANPAHYFILVGPVQDLRGGLRRDGLPARSARARPRCGSGRTGTRRSAACSSAPAAQLRPDRLPARRRLAPHLRPGRDALGPHPPPLAHRRRHCGPSSALAVLFVRAVRANRPKRGPRALRGRARPARRRSPEASCSVCRKPSGRVRLRRAPVSGSSSSPILLMLAAGVALVAIRQWAGRGAAARRRCLLHRHPRKPLAADRPRAPRDHPRTCPLYRRGAPRRGDRVTRVARPAADLRPVVGGSPSAPSSLAGRWSLVARVDAPPLARHPLLRGIAPRLRVGGGCGWLARGSAPAWA